MAAGGMGRRIVGYARGKNSVVRWNGKWALYSKIEQLGACLYNLLFQRPSSLSPTRAIHLHNLINRNFERYAISTWALGVILLLGRAVSGLSLI